MKSFAEMITVAALLYTIFVEDLGWVRWDEKTAREP